MVGDDYIRCVEPFQGTVRCFCLPIQGELPTSVENGDNGCIRTGGDQAHFLRVSKDNLRGGVGRFLQPQSLSGNSCHCKSGNMAEDQLERKLGDALYGCTVFRPSKNSIQGRCETGERGTTRLLPQHRTEPLSFRV